MRSQIITIGRLRMLGSSVLNDNHTTLRRSFANSSSSGRKLNPYLVLGLPPSSSFSAVQKAFNKLAFRHHPDTTGNSSVSAEFIEIRQAYERIRDAKGGSSKAGVDEDKDGGHEPPTSTWTEYDFLDYFHRQTGVRLTSDQRRELVQLYRSRVKGGYYGGHSWELARRLVLEQDAFLRNMQDGGPSRRSASFQRASPTGGSTERAEGNNMRRRRKR